MATQSTKLEIYTVRINLLDPPEYRNTNSAKDQRYVNGFFDPVYNQIKKSMDFFFTKRPGLSRNIQPSGGAGIGRGIYSWKGALYSVIGTQIYKNSTNLGVTLTTSTGRIDFAETRPGATTQFLGVNDGISLYLITTTGTVTVLNNVAISANTLANPTVITTATAHGLTTGNIVYVVGNITSVPSINGASYVVTVTSPTTFTIPVNVTTAGTGGTLGVFPTGNTTDLVYMDGYWCVMKSDFTIWNCELDNPLIWDPTKFITAQMYEGSGVALARQNNYMFAFGTKSMQAFFDNANTTGSFLTNVEPAVQQVGCISNDSVGREENTVIWVSNSKLGGYTVWKLEGTSSTKDIGIPAINRLFPLEGTNLATCEGQMLRVGGKLFYMLTLITADRTFMYDLDLDIWCEWTAADGTSFSCVMITQFNNILVVQHKTNGWLYNMSISTYQDDSVNFPVLGRTHRFDSDTMKRKFCYEVDLIGDQQSTTTNVDIQYSDDDYVTTSTARTYDMSLTRTFGFAWGNFRRRSWQVGYTGNGPFRVVGLEINFAIGDY